MLDNEIKSENEYNSPETTSLPVLRPCLTTPTTKPDDRTGLRASVRSVGKDFNRSSSQDSSLLNKVVLNFRTSIIRQMTHRYPSDTVTNEVDHKIFFIFIDYEKFHRI